MFKPTQDFDELILRATEQPLNGWDFTYLEGRVNGQPLPWDYTREILQHVKMTSALLDMGTGGGEFLSSLVPLPADTCATEAYPPNIPIARERLTPLGIQVFAVQSDDELPFPDERFDLVINRHESYSPTEVFRILKPGGRFITQQVGGENNHDLNRALTAPVNAVDAKWNLQAAVEELKQAGFTLGKTIEAYPIVGFSDVNALVYYLRMIPWQVPDFTLEAYLPSVRRIHEQILAEGPLMSREHRFFVEVIKCYSLLNDGKIHGVLA